VSRLFVDARPRAHVGCRVPVRTSDVFVEHEREQGHVPGRDTHPLFDVESEPLSRSRDAGAVRNYARSPTTANSSGSWSTRTRSSSRQRRSRRAAGAEAHASPLAGPGSSISALRDRGDDALRALDPRRGGRPRARRGWRAGGRRSRTGMSAGRLGRPARQAMRSMSSRAARVSTYAWRPRGRRVPADQNPRRTFRSTKRASRRWAVRSWPWGARRAGR
jgi:hypothetical protein